MRSKWKVIGLGLGVPPSDLEAISGSPQECLQSSLTKWLKGTDPSPTWDALVAVLRSRVVGEEKKAQELEDTFCVGTPPPSDILTSTPSMCTPPPSDTSISMHAMYFVLTVKGRSFSILCTFFQSRRVLLVSHHKSLGPSLKLVVALPYIWNVKQLPVSHTSLLNVISYNICHTLQFLMQAIQPTS